MSRNSSVEYVELFKVRGKKVCVINPLTATGPKHQFNMNIPTLLYSNVLSLSSTFAGFAVFQQIKECDSFFS